MDEGSSGRGSRRRFLAGTAAAVATGVAGCGNVVSGSGDGPTPRAERLAPPTRGVEDAPVTVTVYEDFACPHCAAFDAEVFSRLASEYVEQGVVRYRHRDFPIPVDDPESYRAANAARAVQDAAGDESFFEYAHRLFANQRSLGPDRYASLADEVGVESDTVRQAATDRVFEKTVSDDRETGIEAGVQGTPTVFVDDQKLDGYAWETVRAGVEDARPDSA